MHPIKVIGNYEVADLEPTAQDLADVAEAFPGLVERPAKPRISDADLDWLDNEIKGALVVGLEPSDAEPVQVQLPADPPPLARCSGHCCRDFTLPFSPDELKRAVQALDQQERGEKVHAWEDSYGKLHSVVGMDGEMRQIEDMVIYLGKNMSRVGGGEWPADTYDEHCGHVHHYTCKNLGPDGNCTIYEQRPPLCRNYPDGRICAYVGCTFKPAPRPPMSQIGTIKKKEQP